MASAAPTTPAGGGSSVAGGAGGGGGGGRGLGEGTAAVGTVISGEDDVRQLEAALSKRRRQFSAHHLKECEQEYLAQCKRAHLYTTHPEAQQPVTTAKFKYACMLTDSGNNKRLRDGVALLQEVMDTGFDQNACLFELAVAYKRLGHMRTSRQHIERLLRRSPDDKQGMAFHRSLRRTVRRDGRLGLILIGVVVVGAILLWRRGQKPKEEAIRFFQ